MTFCFMYLNNDALTNFRLARRVPNYGELALVRATTFYRQNMPCYAKLKITASNKDDAGSRGL